jgi:prephenate dehydrogenase
MVIKDSAAVIGLGLIGGSIAKALKKMGIKVVGLDSDEQTLAMAKMEGIKTYCFNTQGMADETAIPDILSNTGIIFLCVPVSFISSTVRVIANHVPRGAIITDTGSVKKVIVRDVEAVLPDGVSFVGGHPMAGSERSGFGWAREDMFYGAPYILTPTPGTDAEILWTMVKLVRDLGAKPIIMSPEEHDRVAAAVSHLPQIISTTLVNAVAEVHPEGSVMDLAGGGWRDTTRIAGSNAVMWKDILISNKDEILPLISAFKEQLSVLESAIKSSDEAVIKGRFQNAKAYKK